MSKLNPTDQLKQKVLRWPTDRSRTWARSFLEGAREDPNIVTVLAVGSAVRPHVQSVDFDILVICKDPSLFRQERPIEVDLRVYRADEIESKVHDGHDLLGWALKFGRVLFERDHFWTALSNSWQDRLPLPSAKIARDRAASTYRRLTSMLSLGDFDAAYEQAVSYFTHLARAELIEKGIYPASRPELPSQLQTAGDTQIGHSLQRLLQRDLTELSQIAGLAHVALAVPNLTKGKERLSAG
jgi:hypothetical protein